MAVLITIAIGTYAFHHRGASRNPLVSEASAPRGMAITSPESHVPTFVGDTGSTFHNEVTVYATNHRTSPVTLTCDVQQTGVTNVRPDEVTDIGPIATGHKVEITATMPAEQNHPDTYSFRCSANQ